MPVEIRELVIKTTLEARPETRSEPEMKAEYQAWRRQILEECERLLHTKQQRRRFDR
jgi:hypothetical protein